MTQMVANDYVNEPCTSTYACFVVFFFRVKMKDIRYTKGYRKHDSSSLFQRKVVLFKVFVLSKIMCSRLHPAQMSSA